MKVEDVQSKRIVIACLNWGYGHVARSIGIIHQLLSQDNTLIFAGNEQQRKIVKSYFPQMRMVELPGYSFRFSGKGNFALDLWKQRKLLREEYFEEQEWLEKFAKKNKIELVISDHRYGFYSKQIPSIFVTHQVNLPISWWQKSAQIIHKKLMKNFAYDWILDTATSKFAGRLSQNGGEKAQYIGPYSRFMFQEQEENRAIEKLVITSGPEIYGDQLIEKFLKEDNTRFIASPKQIEKYQLKRAISNDNWQACDISIIQAKEIISYCGYSTIMDKAFLGAKFLLLPTKGQAEQKYLAKLHVMK